MDFSSKLPKDLQNMLPRTEDGALRGEADFYGISKIIATRVGLKKPPRSYSMWRHGWIHPPLKFVEQIVWTNRYSQYYLVSTKAHELFLKAQGIHRAKAVGMPFTYVPNQGVHRRKNSILLMPAHSLPYVSLLGDDDEDAMIALAISLRSDFDFVCFCVHRDCAKSGRYVKRLTELNIPWFVGASADDLSSLIRLRRVFEYFDVVGSNVIGSHMVYSQYCGARFCFVEPYFNYRAEMFRDDPLFTEENPLRSHVLKYSVADEVKKNFGKYFVRPELAICDEAFAIRECGGDSKVGLEELRRLLGWTPLGQVTGYIRVSMERAGRFSKKLLGSIGGPLAKESSTSKS